jgi:hypothetical protein
MLLHPPILNSKTNNKYMDIDKTVKIMLDNAKYQKCKPVRELADTLNIELLFYLFTAQT